MFFCNPRATGDPLRRSSSVHAGTYPFEPRFLLDKLRSVRSHCYEVIARCRRRRVARGEWVFNEANIDLARVLWACEPAPTVDRSSVEYLADREICLPDLNAANQPERLSPHLVAVRKRSLFFDWEPR